MFKNYFKTAWRNISANKLFTSLNVIGLAIGLCICILLFTYVSYELSFDRMYKNADNILKCKGVNLLMLSGLSSGDLLGLLFVYGYVAILLLVSEKVLNKYPQLSRKFLHIMVGNILFILPLFNSWWVITFLAAAPFIPLTYLMSPYSPIKSVRDNISMSGHGLGLVYYAISWTILAFLFFDKPWIIAVGIAAMSYGDGMASLIGQRFGKRKYNVFGDTKTYEGSLTMFLTLIITLSIVLFYYGVLPSNSLIIIIVAFVATFLEGITPKGLDNLTSCFGAVAAYILFMI